ncbi:uncharacterized protein C8Q71DRAFT_358432 [Rhodofomes roseus]|uniref:Uncharacterized protein n=1 Tax=Rhodofomes roseus TaxID=34475 RepID=A0ABQ8K1M2_9APHY|nr:uncharacterized protein C8Q71DRAFT_358432 [Rhodofomes roseus]KAH9830564.1 hypothetical protein C8Q71DRAFT_358432 [Rhodofomes roseus]
MACVRNAKAGRCALGSASGKTREGKQHRRNGRACFDCLNPFPALSLGKHRHVIGICLAGGLFALAKWTFLDAAILSAHAHDPWNDALDPWNDALDPWNDALDPRLHVAFVDWVPGICSLLGMITINLIDKDRVRGEEGFGDAAAVWRARLILFTVGFVLMAGGLAGSVTVLVLKYAVKDYPEQFLYYGYANVSQNIALMLSAVVLWISQSASSEYEYDLAI